MWLFIVAAILMGIGLFVKTSLYVYIQYHKTIEIDQFHLRVRLFNLIQVYHIERTNCIEKAIEKVVIQYLQKQDKKKIPQNTVKKERKIHHASRDINYTEVLLEHFACERLYCRVQVYGTNADTTAVLYGAVQFILHILLVGLERRMYFVRKPQMVVLPEFQAGANSLEFECILKTNLGNIISILKKIK